MATIKDTWNACYASICSISFKNAEGERISSGTGFKIDNDFLVTNNHVFATPGYDSVDLTFIGVDGHTVVATKTLSAVMFQSRLEYGVPEESWDYAILKLDDPEFVTIPPLQLADSSTIEIGDRIGLLGFQFEQSNLSIKEGIISSRYIKAGVKYLQLDASVNNGNSGGPLINIETNEVVGVVTRKHTGLTDVFDKLLKSFTDNITALGTIRGGMVFSGINITQSMKIQQQQMRAVSVELRRSANVGIGYAYELDEILDYIHHL